MTGQCDSGYDRLENQIEWYDKKSVSAQRYYKYIKFIELVCAAFVLVATFLAPPVVGAMLGVAIILLEGLLSMNQYHRNWIAYRATCELLKHEKSLFLEKSGPYDLPEEDSRKVLAERVEQLISVEHSRWVAEQQKSREKLASLVSG